ncbi:AmiS/UreI family transporter [Geodermatophilus tzadiensis]|uniref:AmiS/UreI family transporter n=1 Tax=Geodermatophilus tzadiensis TaxID=1137988 RepID=A0A2T0TV42_9ACTN|nr:AmiS/UreI family transporter [Geodermatophilus tzadiensis]PRY49572.1 AmiS/UreI family transporter [Geodermatophilus tzadiensis]
MASVGLLYVGAVLIVNGLMLLGRVDARAAAPLNLFVGALQVVTPTYLLFTAGGDPDTILGASGLYLFGFTYLYVGLNLLGGLDGTGLGWFSAFVAGCALVYAGLNFGRLDDPAFGVIWLYWAVLWALFFLVLGLKREELTRFTGAIAIVAGVLTCAVPAFLLLTGVWQDNRRTAAIVLAALLVLSLGLYPALRGPGVTAGGEPAPELREGGPAAGGPATVTDRIRGDVGDPQPTQASPHQPSSRRR